jgi:hypothetical protein
VNLRMLKVMGAGRPLPVRVQGDCMAPGIAAGEVVSIEPARAYWPGDVVAFADPAGRLVLHRVIGYRPRRSGLELLTRADAAARADLPLPLARVLGRKRGRVPLRTRLRALAAFAALALARLLAR